MLNIIITAYGEPKSTERAVRAFLKQDIKEEYKIIVVDPFPEVEEFILNTFIDYPQVEFFSDPGKGKSFALNLLLKEIYTGKKSDIIISTDGDVWVSENSVQEIMDKFEDEKVGVVCGHPISLDDRKKMYGYWSHLLFCEMDNTRKKLDREKGFFVASGYLFAFRNVLKEFPAGACEDNVLSIVFRNKGYRIGYVGKAEVYVKNPENFKDWVIQKKRNLKGHEALKKIFDKMPKRENTFFGEGLRGLRIAFSYPKSVKEFFWTWILMFSRLYIWFCAFYEIKFKKEKYSDGWRVSETKSTRTLD